VVGACDVCGTGMLDVGEKVVDEPSDVHPPLNVKTTINAKVRLRTAKAYGPSATADRAHLPEGHIPLPSASVRKCHPRVRLERS
jgi:hypothetical protein